MLNYRRLVEFSSRAHTYLITLYVFLFLLFAITLAFPSPDEFVAFVLYFSSLLSWLIFLLGLFIIFSSIHLSIISRVLVIKPLLLTFLRLSVAFIFSFLIDFVNQLVVQGVGK